MEQDEGEFIVHCERPSSWVEREFRKLKQAIYRTIVSLMLLPFLATLIFSSFKNENSAERKQSNNEVGFTCLSKLPAIFLCSDANRMGNRCSRKLNFKKVNYWSSIKQLMEINLPMPKDLGA